jgi:deoxyribonuclease-4
MTLPDSPRPASMPPGGLWIGISGAPESTTRSGSQHAVARCRELGIDALEMAWVHKVTLTEAGAAKVRAAAEAAQVRLSVHAPYYINLNSPDPDIVRASLDRIVDAGQAAAWAGADDIVLHLGWYHDVELGEVVTRLHDGLHEAHERLVALGAPVTLRPEVMGRRSQFGDLDEVLRLCQGVPGSAPCIDIAHLHARTGAWNTRAEFEALWTAVADALGPEALNNVHIHISGIEYGPAGERRHLAFDAADLDYRTFLEVLHDRHIRGLLIVESPARESDVLLLQEHWREMLGPPVV